MIWIILYLVPIILGAVFIWTSLEKGETIGTIGESASFEIADTSHLHFEMYKDGELVNPTIYFR